MDIKFGSDYIAFRNLANAINVVREGRVTMGRDAAQWLDADAATVSTIYQQLMSLTPADRVDGGTEALPLVLPEQKPVNPVLAKIHGMLDGTLPEELSTEPVSYKRKAANG
jgi:hypothetical protein